MQKVTGGHKSENHRIDQKSRFPRQNSHTKGASQDAAYKRGSPLEIYMDADETIVLKKYSQVGSLKNISQAYAQSLSKVTGAMVCVADRDEIIAAAGKNHKNYIGKALSKELENIMDKRKSALYSKKDDTLIPVVKDDKASCEAQAIAVIVHDVIAREPLYCVFTMKKSR